jgi:Aspartyl protease
MMLPHAGCASGTGTGRATAQRDTAPAIVAASFSVNDPQQLPGALKIQLRQHRGYLFARARIDGRDAGLFMFDTGSNLSVISTGVAGRLRLPTAGASHATGVGGTQAFEYRSLRRMEFGGLGVKGDKLAAISLHKMSSGIGTSVSGLIGIRALGGLPFTLDYSDSTLTVYRRDRFIPPADTPVFPARFDFAGLPVVAAKIGNGHKIWLILDSGADNELTLPRRCLTDWPDIVDVIGTGSGASAGIGGSVASTRTWLRTLDIFGLELQGTPVTFETPPPAFARQPRPIGRVGGALLKNFRLTIDPKRGLIWAQWQPGKADN